MAKLALLLSVHNTHTKGNSREDGDTDIFTSSVLSKKFKRGIPEMFGEIFSRTEF